MTKRLSAILRLALVSLSLVFCAGNALADYVIRYDGGGDPKDYWDKYVAVRNTGEPVVIDGKCLSACTLVLSVIPRERICATNKAALSFHAARYKGTKVIYDKSTEIMFKTYPPDIQKWVREHDALASLEFKTLQGAELKALIKTC